uniref:Uncharacterized protein n=1 Tax=Timema bartmani TaxID=61472 RepID=A0A7R9F7M9_9NEOP|nr:unnamed protein product [Timema bartmani]
MQMMRLKFGERRRNDWTCCFCCHVRTGTIFLGIWHLPMKESRTMFRILTGESYWKKLLGKPKRSWEDSIGMDLKEIV